MRFFQSFFLFLLMGQCAGGAIGGNWPQFRGPEATGVASDDPRLPTVWSATENVVWDTEIPGRSWSSPIAWGDKVFVTTVVKKGEAEAVKKGLYYGGERGVPGGEHEWKVYCLDFKTGDILWERVAHAGPAFSPHHLKNTLASETPVTDGERVYAYFGNTGLFAYDMEGHPVWNRNWPVVETQGDWGTAASPVLHNGRLFIINDNEDQSFLEALDAKTGETVWRVERDEDSNWSTPYVWENDLRTELVTPGSNHVRSYDLEGNVLWTLSGMSKITVGTPFAKDDLLYVTSGFVMDKNRPVYAIRPGASGDITLGEGEDSNEFVAWIQEDAAPYIPSILVYREYLYVLLDRGFLACYDAKTGEEVYERQRLGKRKAYTASPWAYGGRVFCLSEDGDCAVVDAGPEFKVLGENSLDELCMATPAIANGSLLIRTESKIYRLEDKKE